MRYLKPINEFFGFGKSKDKAPDENASWKDKLEYVKNEADRLKNSKNKEPYYFMDATVKDNNVSITYNSTHLGFYKRDSSYEVIDFQKCDYKPGSDVGCEDITEEQFKSAAELTQNISDWLDEKSENEYNKSNTSISSDGNIQFDEGELALDEMNYELENKIFNKYIDKSFEFELAYNLWSESSKNEKVVERKELEIKEIKIGFGGERFYAEIFVGGLPYECYIWLEPDYKAQYVDMEQKRLNFREILQINKIEKIQSRKQKRENVTKYPYVISYDASPTKYNTIEFLQEITELLSQMTEEIRNRKK